MYVEEYTYRNKFDEATKRVKYMYHISNNNYGYMDINYATVEIHNLATGNVILVEGEKMREPGY
jgi:hypothetical protein